MSDTIKIIPVTNDLERKKFVRMTIDLYQGDKNFVQPLDFELLARLDPQKSPLLRDAPHQLWLAEKDGRIVGRIGALVNPAHNERYKSKTGHFGYFEAIDDTDLIKALFEVAEGWLRQQGMDMVAGPYNFSVNEECGLLVDGFDRPPMIMMPHGKTYYAAALAGLGFEKATDMYALWYKARYDFMPERRKKFVNKLIDKPNIEVTQFDFKRFTEEIETAVDIFNDAWANNWGFIPLTPEQARHMASELRPIITGHNTVMCRINGEAAAFGIVLPNINEIIHGFDGKLLPFNWVSFLWKLKVSKPKTARMPLMGIRQKFQGKPLGAAFAYKIIEMVNDGNVRNGLEAAELSWILESNQAMLTMLEDIGGRVDKTYRIYEKSLA